MVLHQFWCLNRQLISPIFFLLGNKDAISYIDCMGHIMFARLKNIEYKLSSTYTF